MRSEKVESVPSSKIYSQKQLYFFFAGKYFFSIEATTT